MRKVLVLLAALTLSGCGAAELTAKEAVLEAQQETAKVESFRASMTVSAAGFEFSGRGEFAGDRGHLTMTADQIGELEVVNDGFVMYMRMPALAEAVPELKPWIELDLQRAGEELGFDFESLMQLGQQQDPTKSLDQLRAAGEVELVGEEEVRGAETTHYRAQIDFARYAELVEAENPKAAESLRKVAELTGTSTVPMDVWIGEDQLVRRMRFTQRLPEQGSMTMTMELFDFGADVNVELPPRDQVTPFEELMELSQE